MKDPYEVLGVGKNASMEEIRAAYKELIKKYHPDKYQNKPLADLAQEKMKENNEAYEQLNQIKGGDFAGGSSGYSYGRGANTGSITDFSSVRTYIDMGNLDAAATILGNSQNRNAEWHFLSGMVAYRRGWFDQAAGLVQQACNMEPNNFEYRRNLEAMRGTPFRQANPYQNVYSQRSVDDAVCRALQAYICLDCLCDCI